jgi:hypothetical protein
LSGEDIAILDAVDARGWGLRVAFFRFEQRVAHRIALVAGTEVQWVLSSVEGDSQQAIPPSPPLQQLATEELDGGRAAVLLLGMAGRNHWSVSAESRPSDRLLRFDVACRARVVDRQCLHSVYQMLCPLQLSADAAAAERVGHGGCLRFAAGLDADCRATLSVEEDRLIVGPSQLGRVSTHRWRYELTLSQHPATAQESSGRGAERGSPP